MASGRRWLMLAEWRCVYCGEVGDSEDHVPPSSTRSRIIELGLRDEYLFTEVRCCRECNSALGDDGGWTVAERRRFIKRWLMRRYSRILCMPEWTPEEMLSLGRGLQDHVTAGVSFKARIERRLNW